MIKISLVYRYIASKAYISAKECVHYKKLSFRASGFALLALFTSLAAVKFGYLVPDTWSEFMGEDCAGHIEVVTRLLKALSAIEDLTD